MFIPIENILLSNTFQKITLPIILSLLLIYFLTQFLIERTHNHVLKNNMLMADKIIQTITPEQGIEVSLNNILGLIAQIVDFEGYYFYIYNEKSNKFILTSVRNKIINEGQISPSYSSLLGFNKAVYIPPNFFEKNVIPLDISTFMEGSTTLLGIPIKGNNGFICVGPIPASYDLSKTKIKELKILYDKLQPIISVLHMNDELKKQIKTTIASSKSMQNIQTSFSDYESILNSMTLTSINAIGAKGGILLKSEGNDHFTVPVLIGLNELIVEMFLQDHKTHEILYRSIETIDYKIIRKNDAEYYKLPYYFSAHHMNTLLILKIKSEGINGIVMFWYEEVIKIEKYRITAMLMIAKRMGDILNSSNIYKKLSNSYVNLLKMLANTINNMNIHTLGLSELMYRYAYVIAKAMNLSTDEINDIALAAYLSNVGVIGLSDNIFLKRGKYSDIEYELMKLHCEVGASLVESTTGNKNIALYIRHHHERMDGHGYPGRLRGEDIPLGSRIIAVVQFFCAKLSGSEDRDALSFEKAIKLMRASAGTQLDERVVKIFMDWFSTKQIKALNSGQALGPCWEMRCSPKSICTLCPAYKNPQKNCWEYEDNNCNAHGNTCQSCFIKTEYKTRENLVMGNKYE